MLVLNEVLDFSKRMKRKCLILKVDFEKACDCVSWDFLKFLMWKTGFGSKWMSWMEASVFSSSVSILVNGNPTGEFMALRGLCQGDPLSPFLFLLVVEGLAGMMRNVVSSSCFKVFQVSDGIHFEMLQFADDTILICDGSRDNFWCIKSILRGFELVSSLCINLNKIKLYGVHLDDHLVGCFI